MRCMDSTENALDRRRSGSQGRRAVAGGEATRMRRLIVAGTTEPSSRLDSVAASVRYRGPRALHTASSESTVRRRRVVDSVPAAGAEQQQWRRLAAVRLPMSAVSSSLRRPAARASSGSSIRISASGIKTTRTGNARQRAVRFVDSGTALRPHLCAVLTLTGCGGLALSTPPRAARPAPRRRTLGRRRRQLKTAPPSPPGFFTARRAVLPLGFERHTRARQHQGTSTPEHVAAGGAQGASRYARLPSIQVLQVLDAAWIRAAASSRARVGVPRSRWCCADPTNPNTS